MTRYFITSAIIFTLMSTASGQSDPAFKVGKNHAIPYSNLSCPLVEPHLAVNPANGNHMVVTAIVFDAAAPTTTGDHIVVFATKDNGRTWKQTSLQMTHGGDPWVAIRNDNDVVLVALAGYNNTPGTSLVYYTSSDGGFTWSAEPVRLGGGHDHPTMTRDPFSGRLYLLSSLVKRDATGNRISYAYLNYSDDWKKFQDSASLFAIGKNNSNTLTVTVHPQAGVVLPYIEHPFENHSATNTSPAGGSVIRYVYTKDAQRFSAPLLITDKIGIAKGFAVMATDVSGKYKGRMYFIKNTGTDPARSYGLFLKYADAVDGSWSEDIRIDHNDQPEKFMRTSAIAVNKNGVVGIAWVDRRNDPLLKKNDVFFTVSHDGGKTFQKEIRVTDISADPAVPGNGKTAERFLSGGDYMGLEAKPDGSFQLAWSDSRSGVFQLYTSNIQVKK